MKLNLRHAYILTAFTGLVLSFNNCSSGFEALQGGLINQQSNESGIDFVTPPLEGGSFAWSSNPASATNPTLGSVIKAPAIAKPANSVEVVGLRLQNTTGQALAPRMITFGQSFVQGAVPASADLFAYAGDKFVPVQKDVKTTHADGSVRMAILTLQQPDIAANSFVEVMLKRSTKLAGTDVDFSDLSGYSVTAQFNFTDGTSSSFDAKAELIKAMANGNADSWLRGPLAKQVRIEVPVKSSMRLIFDITKYVDGSFVTDMQVSNDIAMEAVGGELTYNARITSNGAVTSLSNIRHFQYTQWHKALYSHGDPQVHIQFDADYLAKTAVVAPYNLETGITYNLLNDYATGVASFDKSNVFSTNGITQYMPGTGGRPDIGTITQYNTAWAISQDERAKKIALAQGDASGAVPWHFWLKSKKRWLNTDDHPTLWVDGRGNPTLTQGISGDTGWDLDVSHEPSLGYLPYMLTGTRYYLDQLNAEASQAIMIMWPYPRSDGQGLVVQDNQVRGSAWGLREIDNAAFANPDGSWHRTYFKKISDNNYNWMLAKIPTWKATYGEIYGFLPGSYGTAGNMAPWQQDYFMSVVGWSALQGNDKARTYITSFAVNFMVGRFLNESKGFSPYDGVSYNMRYVDENGATLTTWAGLQAATISIGQSNNGTQWTQAKGGNYGQLGLMSLRLIYQVTRDPQTLGALNWLEAQNVPWATDSDFARDPTYSIKRAQ